MVWGRASWHHGQTYNLLHLLQRPHPDLHMKINSIHKSEAFNEERCVCWLESCSLRTKGEAADFQLVKLRTREAESSHSLTPCKVWRAFGVRQPADRQTGLLGLDVRWLDLCDFGPRIVIVIENAILPGSTDEISWDQELHTG